MTTTMTARTPEDLLALVRVVLGFDPADSIVMLTFGARPSCHARVDLPHRAGDLAEVADVLLGPAIGQGATAVAFILYTDRDDRARRAMRVLRQRFEAAGIDCAEALRAHAGRWHPLLAGRHEQRSRGFGYDVSAHPFVVAAVLEGRVLHGSREELAGTLEARPEEVAAVAAARPQPPGTAAWVERVVARHIAEGTTPSTPVSARLLAAIADPNVRDAAWARMRRADARRDVELWSTLVRRCPDDLVPHAAGVLGFASWLAGDGALAWCAVDRARAVDPDHSLARLVADLLEAAVPPDSWDSAWPQWGSAS